MNACICHWGHLEGDENDIIIKTWYFPILMVVIHTSPGSSLQSDGEQVMAGLFFF
jgi:hypothetical protein